MKVVHLAYSDGNGGAFKAAYRIHHGLASLGLDSTMLVSRRLTSDPTVKDAGSTTGRLWGQLASNLDAAPWRLLRMRPADYSSLACVGTGAARRANAMAPDIVQLHWICAGFLRLETLPDISAPLVWRLADMWALAGAEHYVGDDGRYREGYRTDNRPVGDRGWDLNRWVWKRKRRVYARLRNLTVVTPSRWLARCAAESILLRGRRIEVIPTGQNLESFRPIPKLQARSILGLPPDAKLVMAASSDVADRRKGVGPLLEALESLRGNGYRLLLLGDDPFNRFRPPVEAHWLGQLNDDISLALAYSSADVFVAPSMQENLANTVIEAMACGVPCVAFNIGGMPDIVHPGRNGYLATPFDTNDLARGIVSVLEAGADYARLAAEARLTVEREFSATLQARRYAALYEDVLGTHQRAGQLSVMKMSQSAGEMPPECPGARGTSVK
jgi:glycosyltransferase involved in cell wall biosynthesis